MTDPHAFGADVQDNVDDILADHINNLRAWLSNAPTLGLNLPEAALNGGWTEVPDGTWTYASATTITVPSGAASIYSVGYQIRWKQGGDYKFSNLITVADELLTIAENDDYTLADAAITDAAFSKGGGVGHPGWFGYTPVITSAVGSITTYSETSRFFIMGHLIKITLDINIVDKGTAGGALLFTLPVTPIDPSIYIGTGRENTTAGNMLQVRLSGGSGVAVEYDNSTPFTGNNSIFLSGEYEI
jgi:hypothetical protein